MWQDLRYFESRLATLGELVRRGYEPAGLVDELNVIREISARRLTSVLVQRYDREDSCLRQ